MNSAADRFGYPCGCLEDARFHSRADDCHSRADGFHSLVADSHCAALPAGDMNPQADHSG
jgi:hypothetical protein